MCCTIKRCIKKVGKNEKGFCLYKVNITVRLTMQVNVCVLYVYSGREGKSDVDLSDPSVNTGLDVHLFSGTVLL